MNCYRVRYASMTATYGPHFIFAEDEQEARLKFLNGGTFSRSELPLITARQVSEAEMRAALAKVKP